MKLHPILPLAAILLQPFSQLEADPGTETDKQALRDLATSYQEAIANGDLGPLEQHLAKGFSGAMVTGKSVEGFDGLVGYWAALKSQIGEGGSYRVTLEPDDTDFRGDVAVAKGSAQEVVTMPGGDQFKFSSLWTAICVRDSGDWKLLRVQGTMDPVENPFVERVRSASMLFTGVIAGAVCLIAGFFIGRWKRG